MRKRERGQTKMRFSRLIKTHLYIGDGSKLTSCVEKKGPSKRFQRAARKKKVLIPLFPHIRKHVDQTPVTVMLLPGSLW